MNSIYNSVKLYRNLHLYNYFNELMTTNFPDTYTQIPQKHLHPASQERVFSQP